MGAQPLDPDMWYGCKLSSWWGVNNCPGSPYEISNTCYCVQGNIVDVCENYGGDSQMMVRYYQNAYANYTACSIGTGCR